MNKTPSKTWMLFESGEAAAVHLSLHAAPKERSRPVDAYVVTACEGDFTGSARRATEATFRFAKNLQTQLNAVVVGYDLPGLPSGQALTGESGGLAFAIALSKHLLPGDPGPVAATGIVLSAHDGGPVGPVNGIAAKLSAARDQVPRGGWILYPHANDAQLPDALRHAIEAKGIHLKPVQSIAEALKDLYPHFPASPRANRQLAKWIGSCLLLILVLGSALWVAFQSDSKPKTPHGRMTSYNVPPSPPASKGSDAPTTPRPKTAFNIKLEGESPLSAALAQMITAHLMEALISKGTRSGAARGRVTVVDQTNDDGWEEGNRRSNFMISIDHLSIEQRGKIRHLKPIILYSEGSEAALTWLPAVSLNLSQKLWQRLFPEDRPPNHKASTGNSIPINRSNEKKQWPPSGFD